MTSPYENLPLKAFWRTGVTSADPTNMSGIYTRKWELHSELNVATAGSCFAQHISRYLRGNGFAVMDVEPPPNGLSDSDQEAQGYGLYSARYGNIYTVHQLLQLAREALGEFAPADAIWEKNGKYYDALRPSVPQQGFASAEELKQSRASHLLKVKKLFETMDVFIFTLGLTEAWVHRSSGTVFPTAPETVAGVFSDEEYVFKNFNYLEVYNAFKEFIELIRRVRLPGSELRVLLTVSPVPLTATASGNHILQASTYSKSVLRAVAGQLSAENTNIDYFPSYEIITNPAAKSRFYKENLRSVTNDGVAAVMNVFFRQHTNSSQSADLEDKRSVCSEQSLSEMSGDELLCEEALLDVFSSRQSKDVFKTNRKIIFIGDSHLSGVKACIETYFSDLSAAYEFTYIPTTWLSHPLIDMEGHQYLTLFEIKPEYRHLVPNIPTSDEMKSGLDICIVGVGMLGDGVVRAHGELTAGSASAKDGRDFSPSLPLIGTPEQAEMYRSGLVTLQAIEGYNEARKMYVHNLNLRINIGVSLVGCGIHRSVRWIASPNMVERTARFRFGDGYVDSHSHHIHTRIAEEYVENYLIAKQGSGWLINHPAELEAVSGFTKDRYAYSENFNDIHTNGEFYRSAIRQYFDSIQ